MPRVTGGSTDDDKDLVAPINRVLVDVERLEDTASSPVSYTHLTLPTIYSV